MAGHVSCHTLVSQTHTNERPPVSQLHLCLRPHSNRNFSTLFTFFVAATSLHVRMSCHTPVTWATLTTTKPSYPLNAMLTVYKVLPLNFTPRPLYPQVKNIPYVTEQEAGRFRVQKHFSRQELNPGLQAHKQVSTTELFWFGIIVVVPVIIVAAGTI
jgi:hypothetical protein